MELRCAQVARTRLRSVRVRAQAAPQRPAGSELLMERVGMTRVQAAITVLGVKRETVPTDGRGGKCQRNLVPMRCVDGQQTCAVSVADALSK